MDISLLAFNALAVEIPAIILIIALVGGVIGWRIFKKVRAKKSGGNGGACGCGCNGCAASGSCPSANRKPTVDDDVMPEINVQSNVTCDFSDLIE